tara:strand:- start:20387 stop:20641 length:255 start_codon:yes stop_codon:yes gene_type:complete
VLLGGLIATHQPVTLHENVTRPYPNERPEQIEKGAMERLLCDGLRAAKYDVMNSVNCRWKLSEDGMEKWELAKEAFRQDFPALR